MNPEHHILISMIASAAVYLIGGARSIRGMGLVLVVGTVAGTLIDVDHVVLAFVAEPRKTLGILVSLDYPAIFEQVTDEPNVNMLGGYHVWHSCVIGLAWVVSLFILPLQYRYAVATCLAAHLACDFYDEGPYFVNVLGGALLGLGMGLILITAFVEGVMPIVARG